ncbi:colanic acid capsular biosynthesis activation protein A [Citrobacter werkmanii]|uniref:Colanic acid capsular biosynthesis activation protein A n=1 Tax=Citrobacter werkmanii TaxID=67827 RepID=A0A9N8GWW9_9ENTR|nr:LuxR C-terminal-related transcriptional regulator [Citrobacter werkmanii]CAB5575897.1 colanic acid capsular biosynthesis activation protein A [Citrobacter werkmanii]CAB5601626.1 colanic acid capsular biosynthesis activation protein A [Citrobacter werkmanii]CAB5603628.1 colanic acid capsular biosynthesis activation protein A [Citrobacter werkmanii]CAB5616760.1 colanic acid capsular biosynthesis activation protein A [Citrobacter werkmanii]CAB5622062.1 colanic acid capsular biosynthesis activa
MLKILVIDRCHFTRTGIEALLNHSGRFSSSFLVSGINNLLLAKEHILQWKPHLVIADLYSFISEAHSTPPVKPFFMSCGVIPLILLQSADRQHTSVPTSQAIAHSVLTKYTSLNTLTHTIQEALQDRPTLALAENPTPLLTPQEEKVLSMWMDGVSNNAIAATLSIHGKTVYTYKRNIRMKLHLGNRFSPFLSLPHKES